MFMFHYYSITPVPITHVIDEIIVRNIADCVTDSLTGVDE